LSIIRLPRLKIDITLDEPMVNDPIVKEVQHHYSDLLEINNHILAYSYEEIFAEKLRALVQRLRPRDLYDVIFLYRHKNNDLNKDLIQKTIAKKCDIRSVSLPTAEIINNHTNRLLLESEWHVQLRHQLPELPAFNDFLNELGAILNWVNE
jgi:predicted nucleotidyltransferase component of viral defense system